MFDKLKSALNSAVKSLGERELTEKDLDEVLSELEIKLLESDVATEVVDSLKSDLTNKLLGQKVEKSKVQSIIKESLRSIVFELFDSTNKIDLLEEIKKKGAQGQPYVISFVGINGTGKTTSLAKIARLLQKNKFSVVVGASDTYRAGAIEQLKEHTDRLGVKIVSQKYGADPAAVARDAFLYAKSHRVDCVLIDTAGRMQTSVNLMEQISKINKVVKPDLKLFVGDSLAGNDTVSQAREFYNYIKFDGTILTKSDADAKGGAAVSTVKVTGVPILYLGVGQGYDDLKEFDVDEFLDSIFGKGEYGETLKTKPETANDTAQEGIKESNAHDETDIVSKKEQQLISDPDIQSAQSKEQEGMAQTVDSTTQNNVGYTSNKDSLDVSTTATADAGQQSHEGSNRNDTDAYVSNLSAKPDKKETESTVQQNYDHSDPFESIKTEDIETFSELFDVDHPENDYEAKKLADRIRKWIQDGRPKTVTKTQNAQQTHEEEKRQQLHDTKTQESTPDSSGQDEDHDDKDKEEQRSKKKKRWFFGWKKND